MERTKQSVDEWFRSVRVADDALGLAEDPQLTIGPRNPVDIKIIGKAFNRLELRSDYQRIWQAMRGFRVINQNEGREFKTWLKHQFVTEEENPVE